MINILLTILPNTAVSQSKTVRLCFCLQQQVRTVKRFEILFHKGTFKKGSAFLLLVDSKTKHLCFLTNYISKDVLRFSTTVRFSWTNWTKQVPTAMTPKVPRKPSSLSPCFVNFQHNSRWFPELISSKHKNDCNSVKFTDVDLQFGVVTAKSGSQTYDDVTGWF